MWKASHKSGLSASPSRTFSYGVGQHSEEKQRNFSSGDIHQGLETLFTVGKEMHRRAVSEKGAQFFKKARPEKKGCFESQGQKQDPGHIFKNPFSMCFLFVRTDHQAERRLAGVQLGTRCRWALYLHSGGTWTESVLTRRQRKTAPPAPGEGTHHSHTLSL